jgi:diguanylate cyclase (GGDEF)-like protein
LTTRRSGASDGSLSTASAPTTRQRHWAADCPSPEISTSGLPAAVDTRGISAPSGHPGLASCHAPDTAPAAGHARGHDHQVEFYETEAFLVDTVCDFATQALRRQDAVIVVATADHRRRFACALASNGIDVHAEVAAGRYVALDASALLQEFMVGGTPHAERFAGAVGAVMDQAAADGRHISVYGEMVALLYADGDVASAIALEDHWNDLAACRRFSLLCAYPLSLFDDESSAEAFKRICDQHSHVIPTESYSLAGEARDQQRAVAVLQQEAAALQADVTRLRAEHQALTEMAYKDALTGLHNRRCFDLDLHREWALTLRDGIDSYVVVADLDGFKAFNDRHGHVAGDEVLRQFAMALRKAARGTDIVARHGGDEFAVLLVRCHESAVHAFKARLREVMGTFPDLGEVSVSLGHASLLQASAAANAVHRADVGMYAEKQSPRRGTAAREARRSSAGRTV